MGSNPSALFIYLFIYFIFFFFFISYFLRIKYKGKHVKKERVFCNNRLWKRFKSYKKTRRNPVSLVFTLNDFHILTFRAYVYGDKNAGSMSFE